MFEISKQFWFEAAHTLEREVEAEPSRRFHGHSYRAEVVIRGEPDAASGMVMDMTILERVLGRAREALDHRLLDDVEGLGPATMENLAAWIWRSVAPSCTGIARVSVYRDSSRDTCSYFGPRSAKQGGAA